MLNGKRLGALKTIVVSGSMIIALMMPAIAQQNEVVPISETISPEGVVPMAPVRPEADAMGIVPVNIPVQLPVDGSRIVPLYKMIGHQSPIMLRSTGGEYTIPLPVSARETVSSMVLNLRFTNSAALLRDRSQLYVRLNGQTIAQFPLLAQSPQGNYSINLPVDVLKTGYNQLAIGVVQHYTDLCEDPTAPELWTAIDTLHSTLQVQSQLKPLSPRLSDLAALLDAKQWQAHSIALISPTPAVTPTQLKIGGDAAQGAALRLEYQPIAFKHATLAQVMDPAISNGIKINTARMRGTDFILFGTKEQLRGVLPADVYAQIQESYLGIFALPTDSRHFVLVISGSTEEGAQRAATAFSFMNFPYPDKPWATIAKVEPPVWKGYADRNAITKNGRYLFSEFGYKTKTVKGMLTEQLSLEFYLPPDYYVRESAEFEFSLRIAYGAALRRDSVLNVYVNGLFQRAIPLNEETGARYQDYRVSVSARSFKPGLNEVVLQPVMIPLVSDECELFHSENLLLTIHDDSLIIVPDIQHFVRMPNLELFSRTVFPYSAPADGSGSYVMVAGNDSPTIASSWSILGKMAQRRGAPLYHLDIGFAAPTDKTDRDILIVGTHRLIPTDLLVGSPFAFDKSPNEVKYPALISKNRDDQELAWYEEILEKFSMNVYRPSQQRMLDQAEVHQFGGIGNYLVAIQYESPLTSGRTVTAFFAEDNQKLAVGVKNLVTPEIWDQLRGDISVWRPGEEDVPWLKTGNDYDYGNFVTQGRLEHLFSKNPWLWFLLVLLLLIPLSILSRRLYHQYRARKDGFMIRTDEDNRFTYYKRDDGSTPTIDAGHVAESDLSQPLKRPEDE